MWMEWTGEASIKEKAAIDLDNLAVDELRGVSEQHNRRSGHVFRLAKPPERGAADHLVEGRSRNAGVLDTIGVRTIPGQIALTVMPDGPSFMAKSRVSAMTPPLEAA